MIEVHDLAKRYGRIEAVRGVSFTAYPGEVLGLLGPNGAGKSTTIKAITGLIRPTRGRVSLAGYDVVKESVAAKTHLGYVPDRPYLYQKLTGRELLRFLSQLRQVEDGAAKAQKWLEFFSLQDFANELIETYSHGMRQKLTFIAALLHDPKVLIIDEPMVGLDPRASKQVRQLMIDYADKGNTVLLTTHSMEVAEAVADRVIVVSKGAIAGEGDLEALRQQTGEGNLEEIFMRLTEEASQTRASEQEPTPA
ncbi:MAG: ABC transporter ATP-binding protein [Trueperaceae bacterium]|nr:ABC transporter ATP-binding protein [Trueperaceae bacterium]